MEPGTIPWLWLGLGILLIILEFIVPGLVIIFIGLGAIIVALAQWIGMPADNWLLSISVWLLSSLTLVLSTRKFIKKYFPAETSYQALQEDTDAYGMVVDVVETVYEDNNNGRIRFQGTSWPAISEEGVIEKGKKARLLSRNNLAWIVEQYEDLDTINSL
ncbi:MAG: NfeD family protein [Spirochaetota bacterium]|nr:NfeD family protein [Spirochaetota bacterium]